MTDDKVRAIAKGLAQVYEAEGCVIWLFAPHPMLGGDSAAKRIVEGDADAVLTLIDQLTSGAFV